MQERQSGNEKYQTQNNDSFNDDTCGHFSDIYWIDGVVVYSL